LNIYLTSPKIGLDATNPVKAPATIAITNDTNLLDKVG
jgi:hypothetical protein